MSDETTTEPTPCDRCGRALDACDCVARRLIIPRALWDRIVAECDTLRAESAGTSCARYLPGDLASKLLALGLDTWTDALFPAERHEVASGKPWKPNDDRRKASKKARRK